MSEPTVRPSIPFNDNPYGPLFDPELTLPPRLAEEARPKKVIPTAGGKAIDMLQEIKTQVPPECMLYEKTEPEFVLGKHPAVPSFYEKVPTANSWQPPKEPFVFVPQWVVPPKVKATPVYAPPAKNEEGATKMEELINKLDLSHVVDEVRDLALEQKHVNPELPPPSVTPKKSAKDSTALPHDHKAKHNKSKGHKK